MSTPRWIPFVGLALLTAPASARQFTPVSQARSITINAYGNNMGAPPTTNLQTVQAPDFGLFDEELQAGATGTHGASHGIGMQTSTIGSSSVSASGSGSGTATAPQLDPDAGAQAEARSEFEFAFDVTTDSLYTSSGYCQAAGDSPWAAVTLTGSNGMVFGVFPGPGQETLPVDFSGVLAPGQYTLHCVAEGFEFAGVFYGFWGAAAFDIEFSVDGMPVDSYCTALPNSANTPALMAASGPLSIAANGFGLEATGVVPGVQGLFFYGSAPIMAPFGNGFRCVGGSTHRLQRPVAADGLGVAARAIDFTSFPTGAGAPGAIEVGSTWHFQYWYRDLAAGGAGFNLSNGLSVTFLP